MACSSPFSKPGSSAPKEVSVSFVLETDNRPRSLSALSRAGLRRSRRMRTRTGMPASRPLPILSESDDDCVPGTPMGRELSKDVDDEIEIQSFGQDSTPDSTKCVKSFSDYPIQSAMSRKHCVDSHDENSDDGVRWYDGPGRYPGSFTTGNMQASNNASSREGPRTVQVAADPNNHPSNMPSSQMELKMNEEDDCPTTLSGESIDGKHGCNADDPDSSGLEGYCSEKAKKKFSVDDVRTVISGTIQLLESQISWLEMRLGQAHVDAERNGAHTLMSLHSQVEKELYTRRRNLRKETLLALQEWLYEYV
jgi:hypothetical protein